MSNMKKSLEEMDVIDDFLMEQLAADEEIGSDFCRRMLSTLLQRDLKRIRVVSQRILPSLTPNLRGIRMDVESGGISVTVQLGTRIYCAYRKNMIRVCQKPIAEGDFNGFWQ